MEYQRALEGLFGAKIEKQENSVEFIRFRNLQNGLRLLMMKFNSKIKDHFREIQQFSNYQSVSSFKILYLTLFLQDMHVLEANSYTYDDKAFLDFKKKRVNSTQKLNQTQTLQEKYAKLKS